MAPALASAELESDELLDDELELILADGDGLAFELSIGIVAVGVMIGVEIGKGEPIALGPTIGVSMEVSVTV